MIQPLDIKTQKFKKGLFGYKPIDVDGFVDSVYRAYDELFKENTELSDNLEKLNASLQENRLKMFELENKLQKVENVSSYDDEASALAKQKADEIIKNAEAAAAEIIAKAKTEGKKYESVSEPPKMKISEPENKTVVREEIKEEAKKDEPKESASSRFFKKEESQPANISADDDDDEIFVGEIEDARKPDRMMIGDGEEDEDADFEFL